MSNNKQLPQERIDELFSIVKARFENHMHRHKELKWPEVQAALEGKPDKVWSLNEMEETGGEPDVVGYDTKTKEYIFYDCSPKAPRDAGAFVMTKMPWSPANSTNPNTAPWEWLRRWG